MAASSMVAELENLRALLDKPAAAIAADTAAVAAGPPTTYAGALNTAEVCRSIGGALFTPYAGCCNCSGVTHLPLDVALGLEYISLDLHASKAAALAFSAKACLRSLCVVCTGERGEAE